MQPPMNHIPAPPSGFFFEILEKIFHTPMQMGTFILVVQVIGILIPLVSILILFFKEQTREATCLQLADIACLIINCCYFFMLQAKDTPEAMLALRIGFVGNVLFFIFFAMFITVYLRITCLKYILYLWTLFDSIALLYSLVNNFEKMMFRDFAFERTAQNNLFHFDGQMSTYYIIRSCLLCAVLICCFIYTLKRYRKIKSPTAHKSLRSLLLAQILVIFALLSILSQSLNYDVMPLFASLAVLIITCGVLSGQILSVTDLGRKWLLDHTENMFLITDNWNGYLDANVSAKNAFPVLKHLAKNEVLPEDLLALLLQESPFIEVNNRTYYRRIAPIVHRKKREGYSVVLGEITEQKKLMDELENEKAKAQEANEAKSTFMSNMSHEIRTPMNAIVGMTDILLRGSLSDHEREYLTNIKNSGNALLSIVNDILDFSKIESGKLELVAEEYEPMSTLNDLSMIFLNRIGRKEVELLYDIDPTLPRKLYGDQLRLRQVVLNIMNNAIKFTESGFVKLTVAVKSKSDTEVTLHFSIQDTGQGIKEEDMSKLFHSFEQVDTKKNHHKEGTGLGLAISKQLIELMGGEISVESEYGVGSTFSFTVKQELRSTDLAASRKTDMPKAPIISAKMHSKQVLEALIKLCNYYNLEFIPLEELIGNCCNSEETLSPEQLAEILTAKHLSNSTLQLDDEHEYFFLTDCHEILSGNRLAYFKQLGISVCLVHNPMCSDCYLSGVTTLNMPLYTLNFCQLINHETLHFDNDHIDRFTFTAKDANILVVDDNEMNLKVALDLLEPLQAHVDTAENGKQALSMIQSAHYDIVLMDHMMPIMDGVEATQKLRALEDSYFQTLPVIALTANALADARNEFLSAGMNDFLAKPIETKELCKIIAKWLPTELIQPMDATEFELNSASAPGSDSSMQMPNDTLTGSNSSVDLFHKYPELEALESMNRIDVSAGIKNCGSEKLFIELLGDFYKLIDMKATKIEKCLADGMIRDYTIEVHALKNTARMIGALALSDQFYYLEQKGNEGNAEVLEKETPSVLELYRSYKQPLKAFAVSDNESKQSVSNEQLISVLETMANAMDTFDLDGVDAALKELERYQLPASLTDAMEKLRAYVADVAMEEVLQLTKEMIDILS